MWLHLQTHTTIKCLLSGLLQSSCPRVVPTGPRDGLTSVRCSSWHNKYFALRWIIFEFLCIPSHPSHMSCYFSTKVLYPSRTPRLPALHVWAPGLRARGGASLAMHWLLPRVNALFPVTNGPPHRARSEARARPGFVLRWICSYTLWPNRITEADKSGHASLCVSCSSSRPV